MGGGGKASAELCYVKKFMSKVQPFCLIERGVMWKLFGKKSAGNNSWKGGKDAQIIIFIYVYLFGRIKIWFNFFFHWRFI